MAGSMQPIVATDNGFMFRRFGPNDWRLVNVADVFGENSHYMGDIICYGMYSSPNAPNWVYAEWYDLPAWSSDGGKTWTNTPDNDPVYGFFTPSPQPGSQGGDYPFRRSNSMINGLSSGVDDDGYVWGFSKLAAEAGDPTKPYYAHKSLDRTGRGHAAVFPLPQSSVDYSINASYGTWVSDGYVWWFSTPPSLTCGIPGVDPTGWIECMTDLWSRPNPNPGILHRVRTDGSGYAEFPITMPHPFAYESFVLTGWYGAKQLTIWEVFNTSGGPPYSRIPQPWGEQPWPTQYVMGPCIVDIRNPDAPSHHFMPLNPFGAGWVIQNLIPVDDDVVLALAWLGVHENGEVGYGSLWRSADKGHTWTQVAGPHHGLYSALTDFGTGFDNEVCSIVINHANRNEIWVATAVPYVWHSLDRGLTWAYETVDTSPTAGYEGEGPYEWTAIAMGADPETLAPGVAKYNRLGTSRSWFARTNLTDA